MISAEAAYNVLAMLNIYKRSFAVNVAEQWQYRANLLFYLLFWVVSPVIFLSVWTSVARAQGSVNGMSAADFANYYLIMLPVSIATADITIHVFAYKIQDGSLSNELILPVHPIYTRALMGNLGFKLIQLVVFVPAWIVLLLLFKPSFGVTPASFALGSVACMLGFAVAFMFGVVISCIAFWTTRVYWIDQLVRFAIGTMLSGEFIPLNLLPKFLQVIAQVLPYQLSIYFPTKVFMNQMPPRELALNFGLQIVWLLIFIVIARWQWSSAMKRYSAVGA